MIHAVENIFKSNLLIIIVKIKLWMKLEWELNRCLTNLFFIIIIHSRSIYHECIIQTKSQSNWYCW